MKYMTKNVLALLSTMILLAAAGCNSQNAVDVVVEYDGGSLTLADLEAHRAKMMTDSRFRENTEQVTPEFVLTHAVNMEMIIAKGLKENLHLDPRIRAEIHYDMANLFLEIMQENLVPEIDKDTFTDEEVRAYFDAHPENYCTPAAYDLFLIRAEGPESLDTARARIEAGELDFEAAALEYSTDDATREKGGSVGKRALKRFRPAWRETVEGLETGSITGPLQFGDHWYLFRLAGKTDPVPDDFEEKKAYVRNDLLYSKYRDAWQATYEKLKQEFSLEMDETMVEKFYSDAESK